MHLSRKPVFALVVGAVVATVALVAPYSSVAADSVTLNGKTRTLNGTNVARASGFLVKYTPAHGASTRTNRYGFEAKVIGGVVTRVADGGGNMTIPSDGDVLSGHGSSRTWLRKNAKVGVKVVGSAGTSSPASAPTATTSPTPSTRPTPSSGPPATAPTSCGANWAAWSGTPWRGGQCSPPGYTNHVIPSSPVLNSAETTKVRTIPDMMLNIDEYSEPVFQVTSGTPVRTVKCISYGCVGGSSAPIRGDEVVAPGTDGQLIVVDTAGRRSYEFYQTSRDADGTVKINADGTVTVGSMSIVDLDGLGNKTASGQNLNITGAGVSRMFGLIRASEVRAAATNPATAIPHALQV